MFVSRFVDKVSGFSNGLAILMLLAMFCHIIIEIILRNVFNTSTFVLDEFVGYAVSSLTFLALGQAFRSNSLIQVTILRDRVPGHIGLLLDIFGRLVAALVGAILIFYLARNVIRDISRGTVSSSIAEVPQFIPESIVLFGTIVFFICVVESIVSLLMSRNGQHSQTITEGR